MSAVGAQCPVPAQAPGIGGLFVDQRLCKAVHTSAVRRHRDRQCARTRGFLSCASVGHARSAELRQGSVPSMNEVLSTRGTNSALVALAGSPPAPR